MFLNILFYNFCLYLDKGVKVVRSSEDILTLIRSYDNQPLNNVSDVETASHLIENNCTKPLQNISSNLPENVLKSLGPKRMLKSIKPINTPLQVSENEETNIVPSNNFKCRKLV